MGIDKSFVRNAFDNLRESLHNLGLVVPHGFLCGHHVHHLLQVLINLLPLLVAHSDDHQQNYFSLSIENYLSCIVKARICDGGCSYVADFDSI